MSLDFNFDCWDWKNARRVVIAGKIFPNWVLTAIQLYSRSESETYRHNIKIFNNARISDVLAVNPHLL